MLLFSGWRQIQRMVIDFRFNLVIEDLKDAITNQELLQQYCGEFFEWLQQDKRLAGGLSCFTPCCNECETRRITVAGSNDNNTNFRTIGETDVTTQLSHLQVSIFFCKILVRNVLRVVVFKLNNSDTHLSRSQVVGSSCVKNFSHTLKQTQQVWLLRALNPKIVFFLVFKGQHFTWNHDLCCFF